MIGKIVENKKLIVFLAIIAGFTFFYGYLRPYHLDYSPYYAVDESKYSYIKILIVGDMMLDRNVRNLINKMGFEKFFSGVSDLIKSADVAVANLEGAFTPYPSVTSSLKSKELKFTFDPALAPKLFDLGFDILGLANNHSWNYGREGLEMTKRYIGSSGMFYYGDPNNANEISTIITKNGIKVGFIGFHEFHYINFDNVFSEIEKLRDQVDVLIVTPHWGVEYERKPTEKMKEWAHKFIDLGADAVIGTHPHIIGDVEEYKGKKIYYSLGNFAFDQYFSKDTMEGLAVVIEIEKNDEKTSLSYKEIQVRADKEGTRVKLYTEL